METVIAALIGAVGGTIVCLINNHFSHKKAMAENNAHKLEMEAKQQQIISMIEYKLDELTKHVEKHNQVIERTYKLEQLAVLFDEKMKVANKRIGDLERHQEET